MLAYSGAKVQSRFYPGDLVTCTGDREIRSVSGRVGIYGKVSDLFQRNSGGSLRIKIIWKTVYNLPKLSSLTLNRCFQKSIH